MAEQNNFPTKRICFSNSIRGRGSIPRILKHKHKHRWKMEVNLNLRICSQHLIDKAEGMNIFSHNKQQTTSNNQQTTTTTTTTTTTANNKQQATTNNQQQETHFVAEVHQRHFPGWMGRATPWAFDGSRDKRTQGTEKKLWNDVNGLEGWVSWLWKISFRVFL